jgi:hypothetical protein
MRRHALVLVLAAGCSSMPGPPASEGTTSARVAPPDGGDPRGPQAPGAPDPEPDRLEQGRRLEAERHYSLALAWFNRADFEKAKVEAQLAVERWPGHLAARKLLSDIGDLIVGAPTGFPGLGEQELRLAAVMAEQQRLEITNHVIQGTRFLDAKLYASALREFENAEFKIRNMPYDVKSVSELLPRVRALAARAKSSIRE